MKDNWLLVCLLFVFGFVGVAFSFTLDYANNSTWVQCNLTAQEGDSIPSGGGEAIMISNFTTGLTFNSSIILADLSIEYNSPGGLCPPDNHFYCYSEVTDLDENIVWDDSIDFCATTATSTTTTEPSTTTTVPETTTSPSTTNGGPGTLIGYSIPNENYGTLPGLNSSAGDLPSSGMSNTSGLGGSGGHILGLEVPNFLKYLAFGISLCLLLLRPYLLGSTLCAVSLDFFTFVFLWNPTTVSLALIINVMCGYGWYLEVKK